MTSAALQAANNAAAYCLPCLLQISFGESLSQRESHVEHKVREQQQDSNCCSKEGIAAGAEDAVFLSQDQQDVWFLISTGESSQLNSLTCACSSCACPAQQLCTKDMSRATRKQSHEELP